MSCTMISCRILSCLLLVLLSQYADAKKPHLESISESLQRIESMLIKQLEQNGLNCLVPAEKLHSLLVDHQTSSNESNEAARRTLDFQNDILSTLKKLKHRRKNQNRNENANINENVNANINENTNRYHRRSFSGDPHLSKSHNQNMNSNVNLNSNLNRNRDDLFVFSDEDDEV